jgi:hypothetical protein
MLFLAGAPVCPSTALFGTSFKLFFWAVAVRSEGSVAAAARAAVESGGGEVSSGKVVLHSLSLETFETKDFSLAGR